MSSNNDGGRRALKPSLKQRRTERGLTQEELARLVGLSRQGLNQIENASVVPSTAIALQLGRALGCRVEELFALRESGELRAILAQPLGEGAAGSGNSTRVVLGSFAGGWVAHKLDPRQRPRDLSLAADALLSGPAKQRASATVRLKPLEDPARLEGNLLIAGCDPALGLLSERAARTVMGSRIVWLEVASAAALGALARTEVHLAGAHLFDEESGEYNVPFVRKSFAGKSMVVITVAQIEEGLAVAPGNPHRIKSLAQLARPGRRIINREAGAGARRLLDRQLKKEGLAPSQLAGYQTHAPGHLEAARAVAIGAADAAMVTCATALALGLDFLPFASERFDLAVAKESLAEPRVTRLLETLASASFRQELACIGGYQTHRSGSIAAELSI